MCPQTTKKYLFLIELYRWNVIMGLRWKEEFEFAGSECEDI